MIATLAPSFMTNSFTIKASGGDAKSAEVVSKIPTVVIKPTQEGLSVNAGENPTIGEIKQRIADLSQKYGLDYEQLSSVIQCESQFKTSATGDKGLAFGIAQFHLATFNGFCKGDYYNTFDQLECMAYMFSINQAKHWSCFNRLYSNVILHSGKEKNNGQISMK